ncbi:MAG TPA: thioredoxin domain-containing protein [Acidobacteriota bacterium]|nr:thioredoxin domain-containing protein [Acidobacteriota bacterium]
MFKNRLYRASGLVLSILLLQSGVIFSQAGNNDDRNDVLAEIGDEQITRSEIELRAAIQLESLRNEELRFAAEQKKKRHEILEKTLDQMISERLLELEATEQGVSRDELIQKEIQARTEQPSDAEADKFYEENKSRIRGSKEDVLPQIKAFLARQQSQKVLDDYLAGLREKYGVESNLEPLRFDIDTNGKPALGPENAPVTIVEFSDFECPYCSQFTNTMKQVKESYGDQVRIVFRHFPLRSIHPNAQKAAEASLCAGDQAKFWEMHDLLFEDQQHLTVAHLKEKAVTLELDLSSFEECLDSGKYTEDVQEDVTAGLLAGVSGTPAIFVNGRPFSGAISFEELSKAVEEELAGK